MRQAGADARLCEGDPSGGDGPDDLGEHPGEDHGDDDLGRAAQDPEGDRRRDVERRWSAPGRSRGPAGSTPAQGDAERHDAISRAARIRARDPAIGRGRSPATGRSPAADAAERGDLLVARPRSGRPAASRPAASQPPDHQPGDAADPDRRRPTTTTSSGTEPNAIDGERRAEARCRARPAWAGRRSAAATRRIPPRSRKAARASGQVAGVASVTSSAASQRRPAGHGAGLADAPGLGTAQPGREDLESLEGSLDEARSRRRSGRSRRREAPSGRARSGRSRSR